MVNRYRFIKSRYVMELVVFDGVNVQNEDVYFRCSTNRMQSRDLVRRLD